MATGPSMPTRQRDQEPPGGGSRRAGVTITPTSLFLVLVLFWVLTQTGLVLVLGLMALLLGTVLEGPVARLETRRFPRAAAIATVYAGLIGSVVLLVLLIVPVVRDQAGDFRNEIPGQLRELEVSWEDSSNPLLHGPGRDFLRSGIEFVEQPTANEDTAQRAIPIVTSVGGGIVYTLTVLVITFYYLLEKKLIRRVIIGQLTEKYQPRVDRLWTEVESKVGGWMRGQFVLCLIIGGAATIAYGLIGLSFWPLLGLWAGVTEIIPIVGPWIGVIPAIIVALTQGWQTALITGIFFAGLQAAENWFLVPRVMRGAVGLTPLTVFLAILAGTQLMGVAGAVLAIPIAATIQVILTDWLDQRRAENGAGASTTSGWRWMLNRSIGRDFDESDLEDEDESADDAGHGQVVSERDYPGTEELTPTEEEEAMEDAAATWPATPWRPRSGSVRRGSGPARAWRGMSRTTPPAENPEE